MPLPTRSAGPESSRPRRLREDERRLHPAENDGVNAFNGQTLQALARRGLVRFKLGGGRPAAAYITPKGRCMLALVRKPGQPEMALP